MATNDDTEGAIGIVEQCWANSLGRCSSESDREHILTSSVFRRHRRMPVKLRFKSHEFGESVELNLDHFQGRGILCKNHNNKIAQLETRVAPHLREFAEFQRPMATLRQPAKQVESRAHLELRIDYVCRWMAKTLANISWTNGYATPAPDWVAYVFGRRQKGFGGSFGLYCARDTSNEPLARAYAGGGISYVVVKRSAHQTSDPKRRRAYWYIDQGLVFSHWCSISNPT
jgi:hypothetical protein